MILVDLNQVLLAGLMAQIANQKGKPDSSKVANSPVNNAISLGDSLDLFEPKPKNAFAVNGVSAIQYYGKNQLLVVERSYSTGKQACTIKVYLCDVSKATNIKNIASLKKEDFILSSKKLILNMDALGIFTDNIEGLTFGPKLANGNPSLIFVSDNNFSDKQKTQILVFEVN